ncbi:MAG: carboxylating nicotinate-nucleotide diphosphorylase [Ignavibacteriales bacterium]|nr:carboxylating nicotinate-nucleotide diphosphorylase [Ignavibacteriales bacterium]
MQDILSSVEIDQIIETALHEDIGNGDLTTDSIFGTETTVHSIIIAKQAGIIAGLPVAERVFQKLDANLRWQPSFKDGDRVANNQTVAEFEGKQRAILSAERVALNFLQRLSGIATLTSTFVKAIHGLPVKILDTRKTVPGLRALDKYAVHVGGGKNHRMRLDDGILVKDNHIKLAGGITQAVRRLRETLGDQIKIEVEASSLAEVKEALAAKVETILLDNMSVEQLRESVALVKRKALVEASGGVTLSNVRSIAETGVDFISIGVLTHSPSAFDLALYIE